MTYKLFTFFLVTLAVVGARVTRTRDRQLNFQESKQMNRIVGGSEIPITDAPYFVQIAWYNEFWIGGTILNKNHILTTAYALNFISAEELTVRAGSDDLDANGSTHNVTEIRLHDKFVNSSLLYNVAVLTITPDLIFDETRQNISLASIEPVSGTNGTIVGFGYTHYSDEHLSPTLLGTTIKISGRDSCFIAGKTQICAGDKYHSPCEYDEGSPLVVDGELVATVDTPNHCGDIIPSMLTSTALVKDWIDSNI